VAPVHDIYLTIIDHVGRAIGHEIVVLVPMGDRLAIVADRLHDNLLTKAEIERAESLWRDTSGPPEARAGRWELLRLNTARGAVAILAIDSESRTGPALDDPQFRGALLDQAAIAIERAQLASQIEDARVRARTEELRDAAISAISHDLQTPLASIVGAATALRRFGSLYGAEARDELVTTIYEEAERLNHFIRNVLDLTRIRADAVRTRLEAVEISDIVNAAVERAETALSGRPVKVSLQPDLPMLRLDVFLMERALVNLVDNAAKYSAPGTTITVAATRHDGEVHVEVTDNGIGLAAEDRARIFGEFVQVNAPDAKRAGTGLGLAIAKTFVEANGGRVEAESLGRGQGATFRIVLPAGPDAPAADATVPETPGAAA
jgi:two-component system sensor histidine kinase KdpD